MSSMGTQIASLAYPLTAILLLQATPIQVGTLRAVGSVSAIAVGFFIGAIVDRASRRSILMFADFGRALLAGLIPVFAFSDVLRIEQMYVIAFFAGAMNIASEVGGMAFLPSLIEKKSLVEGNSKFVTSESIAVIVGPGFSGFLVQTLTAPFAIILDAISFVFSGLLIWLIPTPKRTSDLAEKKNIWREIVEGFSFVYKNRLLRPMAEGIALHFLFMSAITTVFILYAVRDLQIQPVMLGIILSALGFGFLLGAFLVKPLTRGLGQGITMILAALLNACACLFIPIAGGSLKIPVLFAAHFFVAFGIQVHGINLMSLRQSITPDYMQGRMNGSFRFGNVCMMAIGAFGAGLLGELIGLRATLFVCAGGMFLPFVRLLFSPLRTGSGTQIAAT